MKRLHYLLSISLLIFIVGCERGCTTHHVMDRDSQEFNLQGERISIEATVVDNRNSRAMNRNIFRRSVTHTYSIHIDVHYRGQEIDAVYWEGVDNPDVVDLKKVLKRVSVALSKDGNHLAIGMDHKIVEVLHFYKDHLIRNLEIAELNPSAGEPWSKLGINNFPNPRDLIMENLLENCEYFSNDEDLFQAFMNDLLPTDSAHYALLERWPQCEVSIEYYTRQNVERLRKNSKWKKWAEARSLIALKSDIHPAKFNATDEFYNALNSPVVENLRDSALIVDWGGKGDEHLVDQLISKLKRGAKGNLSGEYRKTVYNQSKEGVAYFLREGRSDYRRETLYCLQILNLMGDTLEADRVIHYALGTKLESSDQFDIIEIVFENYPLYTPTQQRFIRSKLDEVFQRVNNYTRSTLFRALKSFADCKQLRNWKKKYPEDLQFENPPKGC